MASAACHKALEPLAGRSTSSAVPSAVHWIPAVTDYLVGRARGELVAFLKDRIADKLCGSATAKTVLVETCSALTGSEDLLSGLPGALRDDFEALPNRLRTLATAYLKDVPEKHRRTACLALAAWDVYPTLRDAGPLATLRAFADYSAPPRCEDVLAKLTKWARLLAPIVEGVVAGSHGQPIDHEALRAAIRDLAAEADPPFSQEDQERLTAAMPSLLRLVDVVNEAARAGQVDRKTAARAATLLAGVLSALLPEREGTIASEVFLAVADLATDRYASGVHHLLTAAEAALPSDGFAVIRGVVDYGLLLSSLAAATSDEEVQSILESAAAPIGSWREFRRSNVAGFLGGFAGVSGGVEFGVHDPVVAGAPFLPVGFELGGKLCDHSSWNVLLSIVDLGALAATRLDDDKATADMGTTGNAKETTDVDFAAVFAPGVFVGIGLGDSPFVLGVGAEYLPASRAVFTCPDANACADTRNEPVVRAMGFLAIDLPVLPLFR